LSLNKRERIGLPIAFGEKQKKRIEGAFEGEWSFTTVEMIKCNREWYANFVLKIVELQDEPETIIAIDMGEHTLAVVVPISRSSPEKPMKGNGAAKRSSASNLNPFSYHSCSIYLIFALLIPANESVEDSGG